MAQKFMKAESYQESLGGSLVCFTPSYFMFMCFICDWLSVSEATTHLGRASPSLSESRVPLSSEHLVLLYRATSSQSTIISQASAQNSANILNGRGTSRRCKWHQHCSDRWGAVELYFETAYAVQSLAGYAGGVGGNP